MRKTTLLCVASAALGAVAALTFPRWPIAPSETTAQETTAVPFPPRLPGTSPAGQSNPRANEPPPLAEALSTIDGDLTAEERVSVAIYEAVNRSVVNITTKGVRGDRFLFMEIPAEGEGSGSIITRDGYVLTNAHVIEGAREIRVTLFDGNTYDAQLVGQDVANDVAVLKIVAPAASLFPVVFGDSTRLRVGQRVYAIGNPFGFERTMSTGIISSLNRTLPSRRSHRTIKQMIQVDAAINPGNSGSPLLDSHGRMIGMNTAIASRTGESAGVGFAIPINTITRIVEQLIRSGRVVRPEAGIAQVYQTERGLLIAMLVPNGPAEQAGLRGPKVTTQRKRLGPAVYEYQTVERAAADLIVAVNGQPVKTADDFLSLVEAKQPGDQVIITVIREGRRVDVPLRLGTSD